MAAEIALAAVIRKTVSILGNLVVDEAVRLYWVREDIMWIETEMRRIQSFLEDLNVKQSTDSGVANLVRDVRCLAYDVEDIIDTFLPKLASQNTKCLGLCTIKKSLVDCFSCGASHKFVMKVEGIKRRVNDINRARITYGIDENRASQGGDEGDPRQTYEHVVHEPVVVGLQEHINALVARLYDTEMKFCVTSIIGMPGVGKTTLAKKIYHSVKEKFHCSAWVYVSQRPRTRDLLQDIARQVGLENERREENLVPNLFNFLKGMSYVIVIDDIWNVEVWDALKNAIPSDCENRSRLILTSRNREVGTYIGGKSSLHALQPLDPETSWELFSNIVKIHRENTDEELVEIGLEILKRCDGLPLAIVTIAGLLSMREAAEYEWRTVLNKMGEEKDQFAEIVALSYRDLPTDLKPCFLYFGLFPEDHEILVRDLINLWVAEGFIKQGRQTLEDAGEDCLNKLIVRNLIQVEGRRYDGRIKSCRIHDVLHNLCILIAHQEDFFFNNQSSNDSVATVMGSRRVVILQNSIDKCISANHPFPKLRAMLYFNKDGMHPDRLLDCIHKGFRLIRVLRLEDFKFRPMLTKEIGKLIHLRYLRLRGPGLIRLPTTMGNLIHLQVLDVQECEDLILPSAIWKMDKLRHIFIHVTAMFEHPSKFSTNSKALEEVSLPNLQSLNTLNGDLLRADCLLQLTNLKNLGICCSMKLFAHILTSTTPISERLERLQLEVWADGPYIAKKSLSLEQLIAPPANICGDQDFPALNFSGYQNLRNLYLEGPIRKLPEFPRRITKLYLVQSVLENDPMKELGALPRLKVLKLQRNSYMGQEMVISGPDTFPSLEVLIIEPMPALKKLKVDGGDRVMPKLKTVRINSSMTLDVHSDRLRGIFEEFNGHLMRESFFDLEAELHWPEDDFIYEEDESILEEDETILEESETILEESETILEESETILEEGETILEESESIKQPTTFANKGKELIVEEGTETEITETPRGVFRKTFELGESSSSQTPTTGLNQS